MSSVIDAELLAITVPSVQSATRLGVDTDRAAGESNATTLVETKVTLENNPG